jgi:hypothetical protein
MGIVERVEESVLEKRAAYLENSSVSFLSHLTTNVVTLWSKLDHLIYMPILGLARPRDLYYHQGDGLKIIHGFTYKYMTMEHFLGQLTRVQVGKPLAEALTKAYARAWYPGNEGLIIFADWHVKPHWTKAYSHSGHVTMWGRIMPGTKQLILNGPQGRFLGGLNYFIDTCMPHILVELEASLEDSLDRPIACTIMDSEGGGLPLGERYVEAKRNYISVLSQGYAYRLTDFIHEGAWKPVKGDPEREAVFACWADPKRNANDPRGLVLMRLVGQVDPTRVYVGWFQSDVTAGEIPWYHRLRWPYNELRIRDLIRGANLNVNYGYDYREVPNRTRQREWETAQAKVETTQQQLSDHQVAVHNLRRQLVDLQTTYVEQKNELRKQLFERQLELRSRQRLGKPTVRTQQQVSRLKHKLMALTQRFQRRQRRLLRQLYEHQTKSCHLHERLVQRMVARDAIDTQTLCRERDLEKDQIMLNWQILLANLHDWAAETYFASEWRTLSLDKAIQMIYRKPGRVNWYDDHIEVILEPYRYRDQQLAMETTCARFNAANVLWRDGRLLRISIAPPD